MSDTKKILEQFKNNEITLEDALLELKKEPFEDIGYAKVDLHRKVRQGAAEVIYGEGKTPEQIIGICDAMLKNGQKTILITRLSKKPSSTNSTSTDAFDIINFLKSSIEFSFIISCILINFFDLISALKVFIISMG